MEDEVRRCEQCGRIIWAGGYWTDDEAGQCSGICQHELCGDCGDWDELGCCPDCHEELEELFKDRENILEQYDDLDEDECLEMLPVENDPLIFIKNRWRLY